MAEKSLNKDALRLKTVEKILEGNRLAGLIGMSNYQKLMRAYKNRHVQIREDPNNKGKTIQFDTLLDRPVTEADITKSLIKQMTGTDTPGQDLKYIGLKQREQIQRNVGRLGEGVTPGGLTIDDVFANTRRFFSPNLYNEKGEKIGKQIDVRREAVADATARQALTAQGKSSYATPEQQQYLKNDERVPQSGLASDYLDGLGVDINFTNKNKLNINPGFRQENIDKFAGQGIQAPGKFTGLKANVNDEASNENAVVTENTEDAVVPIKGKGPTYDNPLDDPDYNPEATNANKNKAKLAMGGQSMRTMEERTKAIERAYGSMSKEAKRKLRLRPITQLELEAM